MKRLSTVATGTILLTWFALAAGCSDSGGVTENSGGSSSTGATPGSGAVAGTGAGAAAPTTGGAASTTGGAASTTGGAATGGAASTTGGAASTTGGTGGTDPTRPAACGSADGKGKSCTAAGATCSKTCGPKSVGYKVLSCDGATWSEGDCVFPASGDYSCFKRATPLPACATTPKASDPCSVPDCMPCGPAYQDTQGAPKTGACVCNAMAATPAWSCASDDAWPPQTP